MNAITKQETLAKLLSAFGAKFQKAPACAKRFWSLVDRADLSGFEYKLEHEFSATFGDSFTLSIWTADNIGGSSVYRAWTLVVPKTATIGWSTRRATALRFYGRVNNENADEQTCGIRARMTIEANIRFPKTLLERTLHGVNLALAIHNGESIEKPHRVEVRAIDLDSAAVILASIGIAEIKQDKESGRVPREVASFADLHDYVDANEYGLLCSDVMHSEEGDAAVDLRCDLANRVQNRIHQRLNETL